MFLLIFFGKSYVLLQLLIIVTVLSSLSPFWKRKKTNEGIFFLQFLRDTLSIGHRISEKKLLITWLTVNILFSVSPYLTMVSCPMAKFPLKIFGIWDLGFDLQGMLHAKEDLPTVIFWCSGTSLQREGLPIAIELTCTKKGMLTNKKLRLKFSKISIWHSLKRSTRYLRLIEMMMSTSLSPVSRAPPSWWSPAPSWPCFMSSVVVTIFNDCVKKQGWTDKAIKRNESKMHGRGFQFSEI